MSTSAESPQLDPVLLRRVTGEFLEMPGLQVTLPQACRLWNTDTATSLAMLETLVAQAFLRRSGQHYLLAGSGRLGV
jgi:hypothetical protein